MCTPLCFATLCESCVARKNCLVATTRKNSDRAVHVVLAQYDLSFDLASLGIRNDAVVPESDYRENESDDHVG